MKKPKKFMEMHNPKSGVKVELDKVIITTTAKFTEDDLKTLAIALRKIEDKHQDKFYLMFFKSGRLTLGEAHDLVVKVYESAAYET